MKDLLLGRTSFLYADLCIWMEKHEQKNWLELLQIAVCFVDYAVKESDGGHLS